MGRRGGSDGFDDDFDDDFALEVIDLRSGHVLDTPTLGRLDAGLPSTDEDDELTVAPLDSDVAGAMGRRSPLGGSPRARSALVIGLALVICLALVWQLSGTSGSLAVLLGSTTPTSVGPVGAGDSTFYFLNGAQWGNLTLDGRAIDLPQDPVPIVIGAGRHVLQYEAAPFPTLRCHITVPKDGQHDTCPLVTNVQFGGEPDGARLIDLGATPGRLPAEADDDLLLAVSSAFVTMSDVVTVDAGDHYLGTDGGAAVAREPLRAILALEVDLTASSQTPGDISNTSCDAAMIFCYGGDGGATPWEFTAHVLARWSFATQDGAYVPTSGAAVDSWIYLTAEWAHGGWSVGPVVGSSLGSICYDALIGPPKAGASFGLTGGNGYASAFEQAPDPVDGCAVAVSASGDVGPFTAGFPTDVAVFLYRFGVILAGNALAHQVQPQFAVATDSERIAALRWFDTTS